MAKQPAPAPIPESDPNTLQQLQDRKAMLESELEQIDILIAQAEEEEE